MKLRGIDFAPICNASGAQGFFGEGYPFHGIWKGLGLTFRRCGLVAKTTPLLSCAGNMPLREDNRITPKELFPRCIYAMGRQFFHGVMLNAVSLSTPGAEFLFDTGRWQQLTMPSHLSFMATAKTRNDRLDEYREYIHMAEQKMCGAQASWALEMNFSCPNRGMDLGDLLEEAGQALDIAARLNVPLQVKLNALVPARTIVEISRHEACDAIVMGNTIPWGELKERIDWKKLFGSTISPLIRRGFSQPGGLSGKPLQIIHCGLIAEVRDSGFQKTMIGCGGIQSWYDVRAYKDAGASGIQIGTGPILRPQNSSSVIEAANTFFV